MKTFKQFLAESRKAKANSQAELLTEEEIIAKLSLILEHHAYKQIPGTKNSVRFDSQNTNTLTQKHAHVYAKLNGDGKQLYSVNLDGSGHDGSSGKQIPEKHADYLRDLGFDIKANLTLESLDYDSLDFDKYTFCIREDD